MAASDTSSGDHSEIDCWPGAQANVDPQCTACWSSSAAEAHLAGRGAGPLAPEKDVDGFGPQRGRAVHGSQRAAAVHPLGIMRLLDEAKTPLSGARALVVAARTSWESRSHVASSVTPR